MANLWTSIWSVLGWGASTRNPGQQTTLPTSGSLTNRTVTPDTALQISAVFACVRLLAETVAGLPLQFFEENAGGARKIIRTHPLQKLLTTKPNRYQSNVEFFETLMYQYALHGNAYNRIDKTKSGEIISLLPYMSPQVCVALDKNGNIDYRYNSGSTSENISEDDMWHNKLLGNGIIGLSPLGFARNSIGIQISHDARVNAMADNNFKQSGVLMVDKVLTEKQRKAIRANFSDLVEGGNDALKVLEAGAKYQAISMNPKDVEFLESRRFQTEDIARFFGCPSVLINDTTATTVWGSGITQIIRGFYKLGLKPYLGRIESSITNNLLKVEERGKVVPKFDLDELLRGDAKTRFDGYKIAISAGVKTINECRREEGLADAEGGDIQRIQQQIIPLDSKKGA